LYFEEEYLMKAVYLKNPQDVFINDVPNPVRKGNEVLIKVRSLGICGSDIGAYLGTNPLVSYPRIIGHEIGGEVLEAPENDKIKKGDKVVVEPYIYCGSCYPCSLKRTNCCENLNVLGVHVDGGMCEEFTHPIELIHKIPHTMSWKQAAMVEPLTISLHSIHRVGLKEGEHVVITGSGTIGLLAAQAAIVYGAVPIVVDPLDSRLSLARELGIEHTINPAKEDSVERIKEITNGRMAEAVIEASGATAAIRNTIDYVSYAGRVALVGWPKGEVSLPTFLFTKKELDVRGSRTSAHEFPESIKLISQGKIQVEPVISRMVSLDEVPEAVRELSQHPDRYLKIVAVL